VNALNVREGKIYLAGRSDYSRTGFNLEVKENCISDEIGVAA